MTSGPTPFAHAMAVDATDPVSIETEPSPGATTHANLRGAWVALTTVTVVQFFNYLDRTLLSALGHPIQQEFSLSDTQLGLMTGAAFGLFYAVSALPLARIADTGWRRLTIILSFAFWSLMTAVTGLTSNFLQLLLTRIGVGLGEAGCIPSCFSMITSYFSKSNRALALSLFSAGGILGSIAGFSLGAALGEHFGWRFAFIVIGAPGILLAFLVAMVLREPGGVKSEPSPALWPALRLLFANKGYVWFLVGSAAHSFCSFSLLQWMQLFFIRSHELSLGHAGLLFGLTYGLGQIAGMVAGGYFGSRMSRRSLAHSLWLPIGASVGAIPVLGLALWTSSLELALVSTFAGMAIGTFVVPAAAAAGQSIVDHRVRATSAAIYMLLNSLFGMTVASLVVGSVSDLLYPAAGCDSLRYALLVPTAINVLAAWGYYRCRSHVEATERSNPRLA